MPRSDQPANIKPARRPSSKGYKLAKKFEELAADPSRAKYQLRLYVAGVSPRSSMAIANVRRICEQHLAGRYELEVVDLYQNPILSKGEQIIAVPTLIKKLPAPLRKFIGDMSDTDRILVGLDVRPRTDKE